MDQNILEMLYRLLNIMIFENCSSKEEYYIVVFFSFSLNRPHWTNSVIESLK